MLPFGTALYFARPMPPAMTLCFRSLLLAFLLVTVLVPQGGMAQTQVSDLRLDWFRDAKLGIFLHWGIYSVDGVEESWSFHNGHVPHDRYLQQVKGFTAARFDPDAWADLVVRSGARYAVFTTKHHDGFALWPSQQRSAYGAKGKPRTFSVMDSPAKRDLLGPVFRALRKRDIRCGAYFSLIDWSSNDYPGFHKEKPRYAIAAEPVRWERYRRFMNAQIDEVAQAYAPDLWWFDGDWEHSAEEWDAQGIRARLLARAPGAIINGRLAGAGDYATPEQNIPVGTPPQGAWELCMTLGDKWGWQPQDSNYKHTRDLISIFAEVVGLGGNLLLGVGPREDGSFTPGQVERLTELGAWIGKHDQAIHGTIAGMPLGHFHGPSTLSPDSTVLYLFLPYGHGGTVKVNGLANAVRSVQVLGKPGTAALPHRVVGKISWSDVPGLVFIDVPEAAADAHMTVLRVELDGPIKLYAGEGGY